MDITYISGDNKFNYRVCGILLHEHKILAMQDARSPYYLGWPVQEKNAR